METECFLSYVKDKIMREDRYYMKISKVLPVNFTKCNIEFKSHNISWRFWAFLSSENLNVYVSTRNSDSHLFNVQVGIVGDDEKEFVSLQAARNKYERNWFIASDLINRSELESIVQTNKVSYLFAEIKRQGVKNNDEEIRNRTRKIETDFEELLLNGRNSDMTIKVKRRKFNCHKCILGARSPVFAAMMEHDMKEKTSGIVNIEDSEPTTFQEFLLYLYTGSEKHLSWKNTIELYKLGKKYVVDDLVNLCIEHIKENITTENFYDFLLLSQLYNDSELNQTIIHFFLKKSKNIIESEKWLVFLSENPAESNILIKALANK